MFRSSTDSQPVPPTRQHAIGALAALLLALLVAFLLRGEGGVPASQPATNPTSSDANAAETVAVGRRLYAAHCAGCHGANLEGARSGGAHAASPLNVTSPARQRSDDWLFRTIRDGGQATAPPGATNLMPALGGSLSDAQIRAVIAFLRHEWSPSTA
jgi:mono/diheme cytochrome c family protein